MRLRAVTGAICAQGVVGSLRDAARCLLIARSTRLDVNCMMKLPQFRLSISPHVNSTINSV
jgi:hypothetical protein